MADVDRLKLVNDQYGHIAGDTLLCAVAEALRNSVRLTDLPARFGGDEFAAILPGTTAAAARQIAGRIKSEAARLAFDWNGAIIPVEVSLGVSGTEEGNVAEAADLLSAADDDLYRTRGPSRAEGG
jgi:diguanylate cyclase (GGDEF)-like protein